MINTVKTKKVKTDGKQIFLANMEIIYGNFCLVYAVRGIEKTGFGKI